MILLFISALTGQSLVVLPRTQVARRQPIRPIRCESDSLDPPNRSEELSVIRVSLNQHAFDEIRGQVVHDRHLENLQGVPENFPIARSVAERNIMAPATDRVTRVVFDVAILEEHL